MVDRLEPSPSSFQRVVRVFVSSTFRDMHAEREELVKRVFPQLRRKCDERGVTWGEVDLRWGIPDERKAEGKILPICLEEIRRCRPYFIGILGERYGWIPDAVPQELVDREEWLKGHLDHSVTELEILHGVLRNPEMAEHAFFYFRDPAYVRSLPEERRVDFLEVPEPEEVERFGPEEANRRAEGRKEKLAALKGRIISGGFPPKEYRDPQDLGRLVLQELTGVIDRLYPRDEKIDPLDREAAEHEVFALSRAVVETVPGHYSGVYIGRQEYFDRMDAHAAGDGPPLVVLGESGSGKSALLANWALEYRKTHPGDLVLMHFIGGSPYSTDWAAMARRLLGEFRRRLGVDLEIPDKPDALRLALANALHMAAAKGRVVLVLDALNQLEDRDSAPDLVWLPPEIPTNVRLVLSTLPGRPLEDLRKRGWPALTVKHLDAAERRELIRRYLAQYAKELSPPRAERIAAAEHASNPLYLRALLEELRVFGAHEWLDERIAHYLKAGNIPELYGRILERYEQDYERERPGLVRDAMSLIWAARRGLTEAELLDLLGRDGEPQPRAYWSPLSLAAEQSLVSRSGQIGFFHDYLREAVARRYLPTEEIKNEAHLRLADYFGGRDIDARKVDELPWHLAEGKAWQRLFDLLADLPFFHAAWWAGQFEVKGYWARLEGNSSFRKVIAYKSLLEAPDHYDIDVAWNIAALLFDTGHLPEALSLYQYHAAHSHRVETPETLQACLNGQALILYACGDLDGAMVLYKEAEHLCRELSNKDGLQISLGNQALILFDRGDLDGAMELHKEAEHLCRELGSMDGLQRTLGNQASILYVRGDLDGSMALHKEAERLFRELGNKYGLQWCLGNQASILHARGDLDGAMNLNKKQERLCRELGSKDGLQVCLSSQALILFDRGDLDGSMALHKEHERLCRELGYKDGLQACLGNQGLILYARGDLDGAMELHKEAEHLCRELGKKDGLQWCLCNHALILYARGDLDGAMALYKEAEHFCRELGKKDGLQRTLGNQAVILFARGNLDGAMTLHKEQELLCRNLGNKNGLAISLANQAVLLADKLNCPHVALPLVEEAFRLAVEHGFVVLAGQIKPILDFVRSKTDHKSSQE